MLSGRENVSVAVRPGPIVVSDEVICAQIMPESSENSAVALILWHTSVDEFVIVSVYSVSVLFSATARSFEISVYWLAFMVTDMLAVTAGGRSPLPFSTGTMIWLPGENW